VINEPLSELSLVLREHLPGANVGNNSLRLEAALVVSSLIGISLLAADTLVVNDVLEGVPHQTTIASSIAISLLVAVLVAINKLLFREGNKIASLQEVLTLNVTSGTESPAASAGSLVLWWGNGTLFTPVKGSGQVSAYRVVVNRLGVRNVSSAHDLLAEVAIGKLILSKVRELGDTISVAVGELIVNASLLYVVLENGKASLEFFLRTKHDFILASEHGEQIFHFLITEG
jgi:hypothetical protein